MKMWLIGIFARLDYGVLDEYSPEAVRNENDWSSTAIGSSICDLLKELLGMLTYGHLGGLACAEMSWMGVIAIREDSQIGEIFWYKVERPVTASCLVIPFRRLMLGPSTGSDGEAEYFPLLFLLPFF